MSESRSSGGSILTPSFIGVVVGGLAGYCATPLVGGWAIASAITVGVTTGYGARWGSTLLGLAGFLGGGLLGAATGAAGGAMLGKGKGSLVGAGVGGMSFAFAGALICSLVGGIGGGTMAYKYTKTPINNFFKDQEVKQVQTVPAPVKTTYAVPVNSPYTFG